MLTNCGMVDFPFKGNMFSWAGRRRNGRIRCRLDRAIGNEDWHNLFSHTNVEYLKMWGSDHRPVLASIQSRDRRIQKSFKFDKRCLGKPGFMEAVAEGWGTASDNSIRDLHSKISSCRKSISVWKKKNPSNASKMIEELKCKIDAVPENNQISAEEELALKWQLCSAFREEEIFWKQKSRATWLHEGDRNTKFFHATTKQRRARNRIISIKDETGAQIETEEGIEHVATTYFQKLFTASDTRGVDEVLRNVQKKVTPEINQALMSIPSESEIKKALFSINPEKAPGPDGMTSLFFQKFWSLLGKDIIRMVRDFFETGTFDARLNQTNLCLIPKTERPREMSEFRPISLCNVSYKIISKVLSHRLRKYLPRLISETQSAFVARRLITDNILLAQENFHALRTNPNCRKNFVAIKTDMSKAYDRVEWNFLEELMRKLGFDGKWIGLVMYCVTSVSYKVLINGEAKGNIVPTRGIRQGDPLSPFLFILCTEALISQIKNAEEEGRLTGIKIAQGSPPISHLLFADDSLFFCKADVQQCAELIKIISSYGKASGQQLNREKSAILFGDKVAIDKKAGLKSALGISKEGGMGMYLGLPETICGSKQQVFAFVQDRLNQRINSWSAKFLSKGGKEILIKSVAQALPTYVMSCFLLPQNVTNKLRGAIVKFWWSTKENNRGLHWVAWEKVCTPLSDGGLGFRDLKDFNIALLAKQLWRLLQFPESLLSRVLKGRYFRYSNPLDAKPPNSPSYGWRSIIAAKPLLQEGLRKNIKSGFSTKVWSDNWIPTIPARPAKDNGVYRDPYLYVNHLIDFNSKQWKQEMIEELIDPQDVTLIRGLKLSQRFELDNYLWIHTKSGHYSVKSGYLLASQKREQTMEVKEPSLTCLKRQIWKIKGPRKIKHYLWQAISGYVATGSKLADRHCGTDRTCPRCGNTEETINHLLFECAPSRQIWALSSIPSAPGTFPRSSLYANFDYLLWRAKENGAIAEQIQCFPWIIWYIWKARNEKAFNNKDINPKDTVDLAEAESASWHVAQIVEEQAEATDSERSEAQDTQAQRGTLACQTDASWCKEEAFSGVAFILADHPTNLIGVRGTSRFQSPLHSELEALIWAMECLLQHDRKSIHFETDCTELLKVIEDADNWPIFSSELDIFASLKESFSVFSISFIPRNNNVRADRLAKSARARGSLFSHVSTLVPEWMAQEAILFNPA